MLQETVTASEKAYWTEKEIYGLLHFLSDLWTEGGHGGKFNMVMSNVLWIQHNQVHPQRVYQSSIQMIDTCVSLLSLADTSCTITFYYIPYLVNLQYIYSQYIVGIIKLNTNLY